MAAFINATPVASFRAQTSNTSSFKGQRLGISQSSTVSKTSRRTLMMATTVQRNPNFAKLKAGYLFPQIAQKKRDFMKENPDANLINLGVGDTTQPIPSHICNGLSNGASKLGTLDGYSGYGPEQGVEELRKKISETLYHGKVNPDEVFVSDGAKCDISRLQQVFGPGCTVAVQDPSYPVYVDTSVMTGQTKMHNEQKGQFDGIEYMRCDAKNGFFPDLSKVNRTDIIFFCSPNNPTGAAATREQLTKLVNFARKNGSIIVYDAAYAPFIRTADVPQSIFEIDGAREVAIEVNSFSKYAGFTGVRLGWVVVPNELKFEDGTPVRDDFNRVMSTCFNGASNIAQSGGLTVLESKGMKEVSKLMDYYLENARMLRETMEELGYDVYGGTNAPYVWVHFPGKKSWDVFNHLLEKAQIVGIPGSGFGPGGEGYIRLSAFAPREACETACKRLKQIFSPVAA